MDTSRNNAAARVVQVFARAGSARQEIPGNPIGEQVWARTFDLTTVTPAHRQRYAIMRALELVSEELDRVEELLALHTPIPNATYAPKLAKLRAVLDVGAVFHSWDSHHAAHLKAGEAFEYLRGTLVHLLPEDQPPPPAEAIAKLRELLSELVQESHATDGVPAPLRAFVLRLAEALTRAFRDYEIVGETAVAAEMQRLIWEWSRLVQQHPETKKSSMAARVGKIFTLTVVNRPGFAGGSYL